MVMCPGRPVTSVSDIARAGNRHAFRAERRMQPEPILQDQIPQAQRHAAASRLPSMQVVAPGALLTVDTAYGAQLAEKARLIAADRAAVIAALPESAQASDELLALMLEEMDRRAEFTCDADWVVRPDGQRIAILWDDPLLTLSRLVQEDLCLLQRRGDEHVLTAALLCFPAGWTLAEKLGRPLSRIHLPVAAYDGDIARRVQRFFDGVQPGRALWRANLLNYDRPDLHQPHREAAPRPAGSRASLYERSERQTVMRLPRSGAVLFAIHTSVVRRPESAS